MSAFIEFVSASQAAAVQRAIDPSGTCRKLSSTLAILAPFRGIILLQIPRYTALYRDLVDTDGRFVKQELWERWRAKRKLVSGSKHRGISAGSSDVMRKIGHFSTFVRKITLIIDISSIPT